MFRFGFARLAKEVSDRCGTSSRRSAHIRFAAKRDVSEFVTLRLKQQMLIERKASLDERLRQQLLFPVRGHLPSKAA